MIQAAKYGLRNLFNLSGRDSRQQFWLFVIFLLIMRWVLATVVTAPLMASTVGTAMHNVGVNADSDTAATAVQANITSALPQLMIIGFAISLITVAMLFAALVRRLHDSNLSGGFVLLPGVPYLLNLVATPSQVAHTMAIMQRGPNAKMILHETNWWVAALAWLALVLLVGLTLRQSTRGANRYGPQPKDSRG